MIKAYEHNQVGKGIPTQKLNSSGRPNMGDGSPGNPYKGGTWDQLAKQGITREMFGLKSQSSGGSEEVQNQFSAHDEAQSRADIDASTSAMRLTEGRAGVDRNAAMGEIRSGRDSALNEYNQLGEGPMNQKIIDATYNQGRETAESERQSMLRQIQRSYYGGGGAPSGAALKAAQGVDLAKMGTLANLRRQINTDAATTNYGAKETQAQGRAGIYSGSSDRIAEILGNTITATPNYSTVEQPQASVNNSSPGGFKGNTQETYGRQGNEMNVDFLSRDPSGFSKWKSAGMPSYNTRRL